MDDIKAKQQVVEKIKSSSKILVTVSKNPSVDALSAALGLTLLFDKQEKYATAIFSGEVPAAINFLEPEKTFDDTTDSLRDFIIALNKEKADHLRYKVEGDSVKIFITPYKTTINQEDLVFSQGDYNVELVIALGVDNQDDLDAALEEHGQILHDATVITATAGDQSSTLGGIDWHDDQASSLSEMVAVLAEALKEDKKKPLIDAPIATALLTGIVAETERFSNQHTTSKVMTVAAQLMSAGADQQLIATELQTPEPEAEPEPVPDDTSESEDTSEEAKAETSSNKNTLTISHDEETLAELDERIRAKKPDELQDAIDDAYAAEDDSKDDTSSDDSAPEETPEPSVEEEVAPEVPAAEEKAPDTEPDTTMLDQPAIEPAQAQMTSPEPTKNPYAVDDDSEPALGGTLNATADQAADDARREALSDQNKTILSHSYLGNPSTTAPEAGIFGAPSSAPGSTEFTEVPSGDDVHSAYAPEDGPMGSTESQSTIPGIGGERVIQPLPSSAEPDYIEQPIPTAPAAEAYAPPAQEGIYSQPPAPVDFGLPLPPPLPDFSQPPAVAPPVFPSAPQPAAQPEILGDILAPEPAQPPVLPPVVPFPNANSNPSDPAQFKIPGQA